MAPLKIIIFLGTVREGRMGIRLANYLKGYLASQNLEVELLDPEVLEFPLLKKPIQYYDDESQAPAYLRECNNKIKAADGYVVVSAEYNHSIPPALSNMMDHFPNTSYGYKPCSIVVYSMGRYGGVRAAMQLRAFLGELGMVTPQFILAIGKIQDAVSEDGKPLDKYLETGAAQLTEELKWFGSALKTKRDESGPPNKK